VTSSNKVVAHLPALTPCTPAAELFRSSADIHDIFGAALHGKLLFPNQSHETDPICVRYNLTEVPLCEKA
jgi:hypothetical protein